MKRLNIKYLKSGKAKASTLIETIIAMVIVSISFGIGVTIYMNMQTSGNPLIRLKAYNEANNLVSQTLYKRDFRESNYTKENIRITKEIISYQSDDKLKIIIVTVEDLKGRELYRKRRIIFPDRYE